ncbi:MAG: DegT/DnrJ/EryC1/StrS family aminotransferase [Deltaproteobacteria bacterium]|nr:DegT/DnrJ/EryC1/StrS family aminotransferase [Deltaproteobacteria bacterium]
MSVRVPGVRPYYDTGEVLDALESVLAGDFRRGDEARAFDRRFADRFGAPDAATLPTARVALWYVLRALDLPPGSDVLMTPITIADMVNSIRCAGHRPVMVEMDRATLSFDTAALEAAVTPRTRAVLLTYLYGLVPANLDDVLAVARRHRLAVIEDVSQALGATIRGRPLGTLGVAGIHSLSSFKVCSSLFGGVVFAERSLVDRVRELSAFELARPARAPFLVVIAKVLGHGALAGDRLYPLVTFRLVRALTAASPRLLYRLQTGNLAEVLGRDTTRAFDRTPPEYLFWYADFQARLASASLGRMDAVNDALRRQAALLASAPGVAGRNPATHPGGESVWWRFPVRVGDRARVARRLSAGGVESSMNALPVCSDLPAFRELVPHPLRAAREIHDHHLLVPVHAGFDAARVEVVRDALANALAGDEPWSTAG